MCVDWNNIILVISDFDGVMTDNRVLVDENGKESVFVSRADGQGVSILRSLGIDLMIISTETNEVVEKRASKLNVECIHGITNKAKCMAEYCREKNILLKNVAYIGNDVNDYDAMRLAGIGIAPNDAYKEIKEIADVITETKGGYGVIREISSMIKRSRKDTRQ